MLFLLIPIAGSGIGGIELEPHGKETIRVIALTTIARVDAPMTDQTIVVEDPLLGFTVGGYRIEKVLGAGGMGKTTVALGVANALLAEFEDAVAFVDLGSVASGELVDVAIATALGLSPRSNDVVPELLAFARSRRILIVLDNCEHVIAAAAAVTERLYAAAADIFILATSREAMRVEGERVYLLNPLAAPEIASATTAAEAMEWPAVQLFMDRAVANGWRDPLADNEAPAVAMICHQLDGIALAIELAAGRVATHGIAGTANLLDHRLKLLWKGRRSAVPRHQTLNAVVDWSYSLLTEDERAILARLSVFVGTFSLSAAQQVVSDARLPEVVVGEALASLTDKSLVWASNERGEMRYRLLDMTRSYATARLEESAELQQVRRRHARWMKDRVTIAGAAALGQPSSGIRTSDLIGNLRSALDWSFSEDGDAALAVELASRSVPILLGLSLLRECAKWSEAALAILGEAHRDSAFELELWEGLACSGMFTKGNTPGARGAIDRALELARALGSRQHELRLLSGLHMFHTRSGEFRKLIALGERAAEVAADLGEKPYSVMAEWMLGTAYHLGGDQRTALRHCESALRRSVGGDFSLDVFGYDHRIRGLIVFVRVLWLLGRVDQAAAMSLTAIEEAERRQQPVGICIALIYTTSAALWSGDLEAAEPRVERLIAVAAANALEPYRAVGQAMRGEIAVRRGELAEGISELRAAIAILEAENHHVNSTGFLRVLAEALARAGQQVEAMAVIERALAQADRQGEFYQMPDLARARGQIIAAGPASDAAKAEIDLRQAVAGARAEGLLGWEVQGATALASFLDSQGRGNEGAGLLAEVLGRCEEGEGLPFMEDARQTLARMAGRASVTGD